MAHLSNKAQTVMNELDRITTSPDDKTFDALKRAVVDAVEFYDKCFRSWEAADTAKKYDEQTIREGKGACYSAFDMAEFIVRHLRDELKQ